ncbi:tyrosine-type recombinase/integrase [Legionella sainthelensi]|uniref:tyrosine-type recombinase/integrase n=1 Tax=Legionella sainthelensi TaxID=28087 RepID=UPI0004823F77|nr:tyrosine-type recombinase/integrase [Legionella sainthelensi]
MFNVLHHKSKRISQKIPLPKESREYLDQYLEQRDAQEDEPLFITRYRTRIQTQDVYRICQRVLKQALAFLPEHEHFEFTPHMLRHSRDVTFIGFIIPPELVRNGEERLVVCNQTAKEAVESQRGKHEEFVFTYNG